MWRAKLVTATRIVGAGLSGSWAMGLLILVGHAAGEVSGPATIISLVISATTALLTGLCRGDLEVARGSVAARRRRRRYLTEDFAAFLTMWLGLLSNMTALAACSRGLSATMDYISGGRGQHWIQAKIGPLPGILGGCFPDFIALSVTIVPSVLFMLGLENSAALQFLLNFSLVATLVFFLAVGSMQTDTSNWTGQNFMAAGWSGLLTGAAVCTFGFLGFVGIVSQSCVQSQGRKLRLTAAGVTLLVMFLSYCAVAVVVSMMVQFQALNWSPVPLLRVFEIRDVDWARLVMATLSILGLSLALLEVCTPLYVLVVCLSREEWRILPCALARENASTGTPVLAILAAGIPASLLACVCPLWLLVQVMCVGPLIDHAFIAATVIHRRYQPHTPVRTKNAADKRVKYHHMDQNSMSLCHPLDDYDEFDDDDTEAEGQKQHKLTVRCLKSGLGFLPAVIRQHVSSGPVQQYYTSLSSPGAVQNGIPRTQTDLSSATFSSESIDVTYMDPDSISLVQRNVMKNEINHSFSNGTIVTSLSYDSMTQGQMDTRYMTNGSVTSLKSIESVILDQSELELKNVPVPSVKCPNSVIHIQDDAKIIGDHPFVSTESRLSAERRQDSVGSSCSLNGDEEGSKVTCHGSVNSSRKAFNFSNGKLIINGDAIEDLSVVGSDCDTLSANGAKRCNNESGATGYEQQDRTTHSAGDDSDTDNEGATLSSASTCGGEADDSDDSTTDIDAIVAEYKERIKVATTLTGMQPVACEPTPATGRRVTLSLVGVLVCASVAGMATVRPEAASLWCGSLGVAGTLFLLAAIARQPQNHRGAETTVPLVPWLPAAVVLINTILCSQLLATVWPASVLWLATGLVLYWRKRCRWWPRNSPGTGGGSGSTRRERIRLHAPPRHPTVSTLIPSHRHLPDDRVGRLTQVDTILISR